MRPTVTSGAVSPIARLSEMITRRDAAHRHREQVVPDLASGSRSNAYAASRIAWGIALQGLAASATMTSAGPAARKGQPGGDNAVPEACDIVVLGAEPVLELVDEQPETPSDRK